MVGYGTGILAFALACMILVLLFNPIQLTNYEEEGVLAGKSVIFLHEEKEIFPLSVVRGPLPTSETHLRKLVVELGDREGIRINSVTVSIRFTRNDPGEVYLETPGGIPFPPIYFQRLTGGEYGSVLEIPDTGTQGDGSMSLPFLVSLPEDEADLLTVDIDAGLSETGFPWKRYAVQYRTMV